MKQSTKITVQDIRDAIKTLEANKLPTRRIQNELEADYATKNDPVGRVWKVGDEYYSSEDLSTSIRRDLLRL